MNGDSYFDRGAWWSAVRARLGHSWVMVALLGMGCAGGTDVGTPAGPIAAGGDLDTPARAEQPAWVSEVDADGPFPPEELRIHPLTGFAVDRETGALVVEVHYELLDAYGHTVKTPGELVLELYADGGTSGGSSAGRNQLERWVVDLRGLEANSEPYDRVTRTYRLTLVGLPAGIERAEELQLATRYTTVGGRRLGPVAYRLSR